MSVHSNYDANSNKFIEYMDKLPQVPSNKDFKEGIDILNKNSKAIFDTFQALQDQIKSGRTPAGIKGKLLKFDTLLSTLLGYKEAEGINGMIQKALSQTRACITALQVKLPNSSAAQKETAAAPSNTAASNVNKSEFEKAEASLVNQSLIIKPNFNQERFLERLKKLHNAGYTLTEEAKKLLKIAS